MPAKFDTKKIIDVLLSDVPDIIGIYIFGSMGTSFEKESSDVDIAILLKTQLSSETRWSIAQKMAIILNRDVDLIDLLQATTVFSFQIISTGRRIYCNDKYACDFFEMLTYSRYLRLNEERKEIIDAIKKRGQIFNG